ncbi:MAG: nucleoside monophosphate kinase [Burkholderiales bacterium]|nr:nucleoside monophosphate kinase [Opitutaceae bacterium]
MAKPSSENTPPSALPTLTPSPSGGATPAARHQDLEIKDAQVIFDTVWRDLEQDYGRDQLRFPKEIILLGGAPGAGKGTNTGFILKARGLTCEPIVVSALLDTPEAKRIKDAGHMVGDREVMRLLFRKLIEPTYRDGVILDGFPRTEVQVECLKLLVDRLHALRREFYHTPLRMHFRHPTIHIMVLFVDEKTSVERQMKRGLDIRAHNEDVRRTGLGDLLEERVTDYDLELAKRRYRVFKDQTWDALQSLRSLFHYHLVNAQGSLVDVEQNILRELQYQSSLELDPRTHDLLRTIPVANDIVIHARQELVKRLDEYAFEHAELLSKVVDFIARKAMPIVLRHAISGIASINTEDPVLDDPVALAILIDVFSERGFHATVDLHRIEIPDTLDVGTGKIACRVKKVYRLSIRFQGSEIRRG